LYTAYTTGGSKRPLTFFYNGGPGSSSMWLHIGSFGPRRIDTTNAGATPPAPYRVVDNDKTLLDRTDEVFIDAVGTGYSTIVGDGKPSDFWGVDPDIASFSQTIRRYVERNDRWNSPKYLFGESYGTFRSAGLAGALQHDGMALNGIVLLSSVLDYADIVGQKGRDDLPDAAFVPTEAAVAWFQHKVPNPPADVTTFVAAARRFAFDEYLPAL